MEKKLERDESNKMIAGVASGLSDYLNMDVTWVRVIFLLMTIFALGGLWIYIILWIAVPAKPFGGAFNMEADYRAYDESQRNNPGNIRSGYPQPKNEGNGRAVAGIILIVIGCCFLLNQFFVLPYWFSFAKLWPLVFVVIGVIILIRPSGKKKVIFQEPVEEPAKPEVKTESTDKPDDQPLV